MSKHTREEREEIRKLIGLIDKLSNVQSIDKLLAVIREGSTVVKHIVLQDKAIAEIIETTPTDIALETLENKNA